MQLVSCPHDSIWAAYSQWSSFIYYLLPNPKPAIFPTELQTRTCWRCQLLMDTAVADAEGSSIPWLYWDAEHCCLLLFGWEGHFSNPSVQEQNGGQQSPHLLVLLSWLDFLHFRLVFAQNLSCHCCIFIPLHLPGCSSHASWTNTSEQHRWDIILVLSIKISVHWLWRKKTCCLITATVDSMAVEVQGAEGKSFFIQREIML